MLTSLLPALTAVLVPQGPGSSNAPVVINEFSYDDSGTDDLEFVELYNRTAGTVDISGWMLVGEEGSALGGPNGSIVFPAGTMLPPGGFYVVGSTGVPNVNLPITGLFMENGPDGLTLQDLNGRVIDGVTWEMGLWDAPIPPWLEGDGLWGDVFNNEADLQSAGRAPDGHDDDDNGCDFRVARWSPGGPNQAVLTAITPYLNFFDGAPGSTVLPAFHASFVPGTVADPANIPNSSASTISIPPSPHGGNVSVWNDPTGGGNANWFGSPSGSDHFVECWVYLKAANPNLAADEGEAWAIGIRGSTDSFGEPPDVPGTYHAIIAPACGPQQSGATGVAWVFYRTATTAELFLADLNNGGDDPVLLAGPIAIRDFQNDGWQRLRIRTEGSELTANFGGTYGCDDGARFQVSGITPCRGSVYLQYRECMRDNTQMLPLIVDALHIQEATAASVTTFGTGSPTSAGTPVLGTAGGPPRIGNIGFTLTAGNLVPSGPLAGLVFGLTLSPPLPIAGAPATAQQYVSMIASVFLFANSQGTGSYWLGVPCKPELVGFVVTVQLVDFDLSLPEVVPIGVSRPIEVQVGN